MAYRGMTWTKTSKPRSFNGPKEMEARFPGKCADCGGAIMVGDIIKYDGKAHHRDNDACEYYRAEQAKAEAAKAVVVTEPSEELVDMVFDFDVEEAKPVSAVHDGTYTVVLTDGDRRTFKVRTNNHEDSAFFGKRVVSFLSGQDNESSYTGFAFLGEDGKIHAWKRFSNNSTLVDAARVLEDPSAAEEAGYAYALISNNCYMCGHKLTVPASIHRGLGPICADKAW